MARRTVVGDTRHRTTCRICGSSRLQKFLDLGPMPLANGFLRKDELERPEYYYPLEISYCDECGLSQLTEIVEKETLFSEYAYFSSVSKAFVDHCRELADEISVRFAKESESFVVEIGSNDGVLLRPLKEHGLRTLGIEPAKNIAVIAQRNGIETINDFFDAGTASRIKNERGPAQVIVACNVFNHVDDLDQVMKGIDLLLSDNGVFIFEVPYLVDLIRNRAFDTMYHEMHSYFSLMPLQRLFERYQMEIFDAFRFDMHAGSIRGYVRRKASRIQASARLTELMQVEEAMRLRSPQTYSAFGNEVQKLKHDLVGMLSQMKRDGKKIVGYGAPAKGNVLLNYFGIGRDILEYIVDATPYKQGLFTPGTHIEIFPVEKFQKEMPDYALLLPWNFAAAILEKEKPARAKGCKFVVPLPSPRIVA